MQANQSQLIKLWPLCPHQTTRMNLQKTKKSGKIETKWWYSKSLETYLRVLLSNYLVPSYCTFSRLRNLLPNPFSVHQSSPSLYVFQVPLFYASLQDDPLMLPLFLFSLYSYQPLKLNLLKRIPFPFFYFPSFFKNQNVHLLSRRIFSFHMYATTLIPFSSQNISLNFLSAHTLVRVEQQPLFSYQTIKKWKIERIKTKKG